MFFANGQPRLQFRALKRRLPLIIFLLVLPVAALAVHIDWTWKRKLSPRGGRYFFHRVELAVPSFRQSDEKWRDDPLGGVEANGNAAPVNCCARIWQRVLSRPPLLVMAFASCMRLQVPSD